jgi:WD40 repeat protein
MHGILCFEWIITVFFVFPIGKLVFNCSRSPFLFETVTQPSLSGGYPETTRNATYQDLKRAWPSCGSDHLYRLLQSTHSLVASVQDSARRSCPENFVLASTEALRHPKALPAAGEGRTLQDAILISENEANALTVESTVAMPFAISSLQPPVLMTQSRKVLEADSGTSSRETLPVLHLASQELELGNVASTSMRQYLMTRASHREQQMHILSLQRSLQHQLDTLTQLSQDRSRLLRSSQRAGPSDEATSQALLAQLDEILAGEQNCERVMAQLQRQLPGLESAFQEQSRYLSEMRQRSRDEYALLQSHRRRFWDPLCSTQQPAFGNNRFLQNVCHRPLGIDRYQLPGDRSVPRSMGRIRSGVAIQENRKGLLYRRISHAATINTHLSYPVYCLRFDRSGRYFITGADDYLVKVFCLGGHVVVPKHGRIDPASYARGAVLVCTLKGHAGVINDIEVSSDNSFLATASEDGDCRVWGLRDGCPIAILRGHVGGANMVSWSILTPYRLVTTGADGLARTWDIREACLKRYSKWIGMRPEYNQKSGALDTQWIHVSDGNPSSTNVDSISIPPLPSASVSEQPIPLPPLPPPVAVDGIVQVVGNENSDDVGRFVANDLLDEGVKLLSKLQHGATLDERLGGPGTRARRSAVKVICVSRCPSGGHFATGSDDGICRIFLDEDDSTVERIDNYVDRSYFLKDPDEMLAARSSSRMPTERLFLTLQGHLSPITDLHYSNRGDRLITASQKDGVVRIWTWNVDSDTNLRHQVSSQESRTRSTSHILIKLTNPSASSTSDLRPSGHGPRSRPNRSINTSISCDVAVWTHDDTKIITSQCELAKQNSNDIVAGSQYLFLWDSFTGRCLIGIPGAHAMACPVVLPHPSIAAVFCSAGADGFVKIWDWERGKCIFSHENTATFGPIEAHERGKNFGYLDGDFSPDGMALVLSDDGGRVTVLDPFSSQPYSWFSPEWMKEQYFSNDYYDLFYDSNGYCIERGSERPPHLAPRGARCSHSGAPFSVQVNDAFKGLIGPTPVDENSARWNRVLVRSMIVHRQQENVTNRGNIVRQFDAETTILLKGSGMLPITLPSKPAHQADLIESPENNRSRTGVVTGSVRRLSSNYRWRDYSDLDVAEDEEHETDDEDFELNEANNGTHRVGGILDSDSDEVMELENDLESVKSSRRSRRHLDDDDLSSDEYIEYMSTNNVPSGLFIADYDLHFFRMMSRDEGNSVKRLWLRRNESSSSYGGRKTFTPQIGDAVVYIPRTHQNTLATYPGVQTPPWQNWPDEAQWPVVRCSIRHIRFRFPYKAYHKELGSVVAKLTLEITGIPEHSSDRIFGWPTPTFTSPTRAHIFELALFENNQDDYLIPLGLYVSRLRRLENVLKDHCREARVEAFFSDPNEKNLLEDPAYVSYTGRIVRFSDNFDNDVNGPIIHGSGFNSLAVLWDDGSDHDPDQVSPWDVSVQCVNGEIEGPERPCLSEEEKKRVRDALIAVTRLPGVDEFFLLPVDVTKYSDYATRIEVPMDLSFIRDRLEADYYASRYSVVADVMLMYSNCQKYNGDKDELSVVAGSMFITFEEMVLDAEERTDFHQYDAPLVDPSHQGSELVETSIADVGISRSTVQRKSQRIVPTRSSLEAVQASVRKSKRNGPKSRSIRTTQEGTRRTRSHQPVERSVLETIQPQPVQTLEQLTSGRGRQARGRSLRLSSVAGPTPALAGRLNSQSHETSRRGLRSRQSLASHVYTENDRSSVDEEDEQFVNEQRFGRRGRTVSRRSFNPPQTHLVEGPTRVSSRAQGRSSRNALENTTENTVQSLRRGPRSREAVTSSMFAENSHLDVDEVEPLEVDQSQFRRRSQRSADIHLQRTELAPQPTFGSPSTRRRGASKVEATVGATRSGRHASLGSSATTAAVRSRASSRNSRGSSTVRLADNSTDSDEDDSTLPSRKSPQKRRNASEESEFDDDKDAVDTSDSEMGHSTDSSKPVTKRKRASNSKANFPMMTRAGNSPGRNVKSKQRLNNSVAGPGRTVPGRRNASAPTTYHVPSSSDFDSDSSLLLSSSRKKRPISNGKKRKGNDFTVRDSTTIFIAYILTLLSRSASPTSKLKVSKPKKKTKPTVNLLDQLQIKKWPEIPLKRISEVAKALLNDLVRIYLPLSHSFNGHSYICFGLCGSYR